MKALKSTLSIHIPLRDWICLCMPTQVERGENLSYHSLSCAEGLLWKYTCFAVNIALSQMVVLCFLLVKKLFFRALQCTL